MNEEIITMLSNLGAIEAGKAVTIEILRSSDHLKSGSLDSDVTKLVESGYVVTSEGRLYLTKTGLLRALSNFS
ncbi:MAG TPA: hypothetical protein VJN71_05060 [Nitrososphaerales archaeon]|nr:hypothetical protein [Nitrososphaerales archaeon]